MWATVLRGAALAGRRLALHRSPLAPLLALAFVALVATLERSAGGAVAADRALTGATFGLAIPLTVLALLHRIAPSQRLDESALGLSRLGADRRHVVYGQIGALAAVASLCGMIFAVTAVVAARGVADPRLAEDVMNTAWIGAMGGAVYAVWFGLGACMGPRGGGRWALFLLDALLGVGKSALALPWPRAHLRSLLGADAVLALPHWASMAWLVLLVLVAMLAVSLRTER